jgi:serine/threonine-protein kinase HipA
MWTNDDTRQMWSNGHNRGLYDLASALPYPEFPSKKVKLAMKLGSKYRVDEIGLRRWRDFARRARIDGVELIERLRAMAEALPERAPEVERRARRAGLRSSILRELAEGIARRATTCRAALG